MGTMMGLGIAAVSALIICLVVVAAVRPRRASHSRFELQRRKRAGQEDVSLEEQRERRYGDLVTLLWILQALLMTGITLASVALFGWLAGAGIALGTALVYGSAARLGIVQRLAARLYGRWEQRLLELTTRYVKAGKWLRHAVPADIEAKLESKAELEHAVAGLHGVLTEDETKLLIGGLKFGDPTVKDVMVPKNRVHTVKKTEIMGPLVLDDLHKTGHSRFPVVTSDLNHTVGVLNLHQLVELDTARKHTALAETAMDKSVVYIRHDHTLEQALATLVRTHHSLLIVINEQREAIGILTLDDVMAALFGRRLVSDFSGYDDPAAVTEQAPERRD
jgi:CBS domain containing-hemolysin-like protein